MIHSHWCWCTPLNFQYFSQTFVVNDVDISPTERSLLYDKHIEYIANHGNDKNDFEYCMTEFLRMSGVYWGVTALDILGHLSKLNKDEIIDFVKKCQCSVTGGFSPCEGHDPHILYTLSAIQVSHLFRLPFSNDSQWSQRVRSVTSLYCRSCAFMMPWMKWT